jgi:rSAM/selenodomain-associated transferase 1
MTPTAVVLLKAPRLGTVKTRLAADLGAPRALAIYRTLAERQLRAIPAGWPITVNFTPVDADQELRTWLAAIPRVPAIAYCPQPDGDLGVRIAAAFSQAFAGGAPFVFALGGDCPDLDASLLEHAANRLAQPEIDAVLGPAADGGYTLLGLRAPCPDLFVDVAWSTPQVLVQTRAHLRTAGLRTYELPVLNDIDTAADWSRFAGAAQ